MQIIGQHGEIDVHNDFPERFGTCSCTEHMAKLHVHLTEFQLRKHCSDCEIPKVIQRLLVVDLERIELVCILLVQRIKLHAGCLALLHLLLRFLILPLQLPLAALHGGIEFFLCLLLRISIDRNHNVRSKVHNLLQRLHRKIQKQPDTGRGGTEEPDMRHRHCKVDVPHTFTAHNAPGDFHATLLTDHAGIADSFVLPAETLEVLCGTEDALAEQAVRLCTLCAVVHGLRLGYLTPGPVDDILGTCNGKGNCIEGIGGSCGLA